MIVAISSHPESEKVERFGHPVPVLLIDVEGMTVRETRLLAAEGHDNDQLIDGLKDSEILICAGLEDAEATRLQALGVSIAVVREGVDASAALSWYVHQANGGGCGCGGHGHGCNDPEESEGGCCGGQGHGCDDNGCGNHGEPGGGCGCGGRGCN